MHKLVICGGGIKAISHLTQETIASIENADITLYLVNEPVNEKWIQHHAKSYDDLAKIYFSSAQRKQCYRKITKHIINQTNTFNNVCVVFYGHPCVFAQSALAAAHELEDRNDILVKMLPGISAIDCLYSDLKINPASHGCQSYEATDFLLYKKKFDPRCHLVLWQFGLLGMTRHKRTKTSHHKLYQIMQAELAAKYPHNHPAIIYEASLYPEFKPTIIQTSIEKISADMPLTKISTLYIPPITHTNKANMEVLQLLD
ncbi:MAG: SAM-dependent methyltransferase [Coxiellaceae bacterium]|nr:SAM-dependent methyltransferase [Coxiellaceae bacterium]